MLPFWAQQFHPCPCVSNAWTSRACRAPHSTTASRVTPCHRLLIDDEGSPPNPFSLDMMGMVDGDGGQSSGKLQHGDRLVGPGWCSAGWGKLTPSCLESTTMRWSMHAFRHFLNREVQVRLNTRTVLPSTKPIRVHALPRGIMDPGYPFVKAFRREARTCVEIRMEPAQRVFLLE